MDLHKKIIPEKIFFEVHQKLIESLLGWGFVGKIVRIFMNSGDNKFGPYVCNSLKLEKKYCL